jgi:glucose-6-phosphate 1-dehydrogenase
VVKESVQQYARTPWSEDVWNQLSTGIRFVSGEFDDDSAFDRLKQTIETLDSERGTNGNHAFYPSRQSRSLKFVAN